MAATPSPANQPDSVDQDASNLDGTRLTAEQLDELRCPQKQAAYRRAYLLQQARRSCPGCGDDDFLF